MKLARIFRSKVLRFYSIERVFQVVKNELPENLKVEDFYVENPGFNIQNIFSLRKILQTKRGEFIFHITGDIHYCIFAVPRNRSILTIHDCVFLNTASGFKRFIVKKLYLDWPIKYAKVVTTISEKTKNEIVSFTGCDPSKIKVIPNPVSKDIKYTLLNMNKKKPTLLFIGSTPNKNLNTVIRALKGFSCTLKIIGQPTSTQEGLMKQDGIHFLCASNLTDKEIANEYVNADVVVFPSLYEGFGLPVVEGFKAGRPVLTSAISPLKEIAGRAAWLVDPMDSAQIRATLEEIISDDHERSEKIKMGLEVAKAYSAEKIAMDYYGVYKSILKSQK